MNLALKIKSEIKFGTQEDTIHAIGYSTFLYCDIKLRDDTNFICTELMNRVWHELYESTKKIKI